MAQDSGFSRIAVSRNLYPSYAERLDILRAQDGAFVLAKMDIDEPITMRRGETKDVEFRYRSGVPRSTAFGLTWHASELDAEAGLYALQDEPLPSIVITPLYPREDTGALQLGTVTLEAPNNMRFGIVWGNMSIYQP